MGFAFDRPTGPVADVIELEYVSALLQTNVFRLRPDASLFAQDVALFLTSRYSIEITTEQVADLIFTSFSTVSCPSATTAHTTPPPATSPITETTITDAQSYNAPEATILVDSTTTTSIEASAMSTPVVIGTNDESSCSSSDDDDDGSWLSFTNNNDTTDGPREDDPKDVTKNHDDSPTASSCGGCKDDRNNNDNNKNNKNNAATIPSTSSPRKRVQFFDDEPSSGIHRSSSFFRRSSRTKGGGDGGGGGFGGLGLSGSGSFRRRKQKRINRKKSKDNKDLDDSGDSDDDHIDYSDSEDDVDRPMIDLMEFVSLLLIPHLRQEEEESKQVFNRVPNDKLKLRHILFMLLHDAGIVTGDEEDDEEESIDYDKIQVELTPDVVKRLLWSLGETDVAEQDDVVQAMVDAVPMTRSYSPERDEGEKIIWRRVLNAETFVAALTHDLQQFDPHTMHHKNTYLDDVISSRRETSSGIGRSDSNAKNGSDAAVQPVSGKTNGNKQVKESARQTGSRSNGSYLVFQPSAPYIDFASDTYRSWILVVLMWVFFGMSFLTYYSGLGTFIGAPSCIDDFVFQGTLGDNIVPVLCTIGWSVARWLYIVAVMALYGLLYFCLAGMGNDSETKNPAWSALAAVFAGIFTFVPPLMPIFQRETATINLFLEIVTSVFGSLVIILNLWSAAVLAVPFLKEFIPGTVKAEAMMKKAGFRKIDGMVNNALGMHAMKDANSGITSHVGQALLQYSNIGNVTSERVGGFFWTWKGIHNKEVFSMEGIWLPGRLLSINVSQVLLCIFVLVLGVFLTILFTSNYDPTPQQGLGQLFDTLFDIAPAFDSVTGLTKDLTKSVSNFLVDFAPIEKFGCNETAAAEGMGACTIDELDTCKEISGSWVCALIFYTQSAFVEDSTSFDWHVQEALLDRAGLQLSEVYNSTFVDVLQTSRGAVNTIYPTQKYMIFWPFMIGTIVATITAVVITITLIPSLVSATLKLRSGVIELMHEPKQLTLRIAPDQVAFLRGAMFWGFLTSVIIMAFVFGLIVFLLLYQNTASTAQQILASIIGIALVVTLHWLTVRSCRSITSQAFYRKRVRWANAVLLVRECAFFALTVGFTLVRAAKLLLTTILFLGRVDIPFLAPGVGELEVFGYRLDNHPYVFLMEIMQHEAHRHPYIELFGVICLLKLKHHSTFINKAGSSWRLLLVSTLMPWLTKYRRLARSHILTGELSGAFLGYQNLKRTEKVREKSEESDDELKTTTSDLEQEIEDLKRQNLLLKEQLLVSQATQQQSGGATRRCSFSVGFQQPLTSNSGHHPRSRMYSNDLSHSERSRAYSYSNDNSYSHSHSHSGRSRGFSHEYSVSESSALSPNTT